MYRKLSTEEETLIKLGVTSLRLKSKAELSDVLKFKSGLNLAIDKIENSLVTQFKKILKLGKNNFRLWLNPNHIQLEQRQIV